MRAVGVLFGVSDRAVRFGPLEDWPLLVEEFLCGRRFDRRLEDSPDGFWTREILGQAAALRHLFQRAAVRRVADVETLKQADELARLRRVIGAHLPKHHCGDTAVARPVAVVPGVFVGFDSNDVLQWRQEIALIVLEADPG